MDKKILSTIEKLEDIEEIKKLKAMYCYLAVKARMTETGTHEPINSGEKA